MIDEKLINNTEKTDWDFSNGILYKMCADNFEHTQRNKIVGKILVIGRTYAVAIERRKEKREEGRK